MVCFGNWYMVCFGKMGRPDRLKVGAFFFFFFFFFFLSIFIETNKTTRVFYMIMRVAKWVFVSRLVCVLGVVHACLFSSITWHWAVCSLFSCTRKEKKEFVFQMRLLTFKNENDDCPLFSYQAAVNFKYLTCMLYLFNE